MAEESSIVAKIRQLKAKYKVDDEIVEEIIYPATQARAVYMPNGITNVYQAIQDLYDGGSTIVFNNDGTITTTLESGNVVTTSFLSNGNIQEVCKDDENNLIYTKTTVFKDDGSIETTVVWGDDE